MILNAQTYLAHLSQKLLSLVNLVETSPLHIQHSDYHHWSLHGIDNREVFITGDRQTEISLDSCEYCLQNGFEK